MADPLTRPTRPAFAAILAAAALALLVSGCTVHKIDVQQGNVITQEMLEKLENGMEMRRVKQLLGTPLIDDPFHADRWDYVYRYKAGNTDERQSAHVTVYFENGRVSRYDVHLPPPKEADVKKPGSSLRDSGPAGARGGGHAH